MSSTNSSSSSFNISIDKNSLVTNSGGLQSTYQWSLNWSNAYKADGMEIGLARAALYNAIPNISINYGNNTFIYFIPNSANASIQRGPYSFIPNGSTTTGIYATINDLNNIIQATMYSNGDFLFDANKNPFYFMSLSVVGYADLFAINYIPIPIGADLAAGVYSGFTVPGTVAFPNSLWGTVGAPTLPTSEGYNMQFQVPTTNITSPYNLGIILGFVPGVLTPISNRMVTIGPSSISNAVVSTSVPQIVPVTSLILQCNWVGNTQFNTVPQRVASIPISAGYNSVLNFSPNVILFYDVLNGPYNSMNLVLCDQSGNALSGLLEGVQINFDFIVRKKSVYSPPVATLPIPNHSSSSSLSSPNYSIDDFSTNKRLRL